MSTDSAAINGMGRARCNPKKRPTRRPGTPKEGKPLPSSAEPGGFARRENAANIELVVEFFGITAAGTPDK